MALSDIKTVVLLMFENRSFDHMLGHLSYEKINPNVRGLVDPLTQYVNLYKGGMYTAHPFQHDAQLDLDVPHDYDDVATQLAYDQTRNIFRMTGFVQAYADKNNIVPNQNCDPTGFFPSSLVPITSFLARTFCTCDNWFSALPTSTQPNRTMAFFGDTPIFNTDTRLIEADNSIFKWMNAAGLRWRVYHDGLSFFSLYPSQWAYVLGPNFKDFEYLQWDMMHDSASEAPQVIIVEPSFEDARVAESKHPNDNHAPLAVGWGEDFLRRTYQAVTANPDRWGNTVMIVYYDEHGGFADHVPPPPIGYTTTSNLPYTFHSLGPRIPGIIVSPFVSRGSVCKDLLDHTSVLQFLAELFTPGKPYSDTVQKRMEKGVFSISKALNTENPITDVPVAPTNPINVSTALGTPAPTPLVNHMADSFTQAAKRMLAEEPSGVAVKYPELAHLMNQNAG
jgi:phospholipase C